jgi:Na+/glutamate symporter
VLSLNLHLFQRWLWLFLWLITCIVLRCDSASNPSRHPETAQAQQRPAPFSLAAPIVIAVVLFAVVLASLMKRMSKSMKKPEFNKRKTFYHCARLVGMIMAVMRDFEKKSTTSTNAVSSCGSAMLNPLLLPLPPLVWRAR